MYGNVNHNIAYLIAKTTEKMVVAPSEKCSLSELRGTIEPFEVEHPSYKDPMDNIFKKFNPVRLDV